MQTRFPVPIIVEPSNELSSDDLQQFTQLASLGNGVIKEPDQVKKDLFVDTGLSEEGRLVVKYVGTSFSDTERDLILEYLPRFYSLSSPHVGGPILNENHLFIHLKAERIMESEDTELDVVKGIGRPKKLKSPELVKFEQEYAEWSKFCSDRKNKIKAEKALLKNSIAEREIAMQSYNTAIAERRLELTRLEAQPIPERPIKPMEF